MNKADWEQELERCYGRVLRALIALAGSRAAGEDAFHDALAAALAPGVIARIDRLDAWLYTVGLRRLRRARWKARLEFPLRRLPGAAPAPSSDRVEVLGLLRQLSSRQREMVIARFYLDLSYREIAQSFGVSVGTATATVSQALARVRTNAEGGTTWTSAKS